MHRYTQTELWSIFSDKKLANELIPHIKNNKIDQKLWNTQYKNIWVIIQQQLTKGMICPDCGQILFKFYENHFNKHGLNIQTIYDESHNIINRPKCPICGEATKFVKAKWFYRKFCCVNHQIRYIDKEAGLRYGWTEHDIDEHNNKIWQSSHNNATANAIKYGSEFAIELNIEQRRNRGLLDNIKYHQWQEEQRLKKVSAGKIGGKVAQELYGCHAPSIGYTSIVNITENKSFILDSQQELFHLLKRVFIDGDDISLFENKVFLKNTTTQFDGHSAYTDLVIIDENTKTNYEVHNIKDINTIERKKYCSELNGYNFVLEDIDLYTYPNGKYVQELKSFIDVDEIYRKLTQAHYNDEKFIFNLYDYL